MKKVGHFASFEAGKKEQIEKDTQIITVFNGVGQLEQPSKTAQTPVEYVNVFRS